MKKLILLMAVLMTVSFSAQAQKKSKAEKAADKAKEELVISSLINRIVPAKNFQFIPYEFLQTNTGTTQINKFEYFRIRPNSLEVDMTKSPDVNSNRYEWISCVKKKDLWLLEIKAIAVNGSELVYKFAINSTSGAATIRLRSNKSLDNTITGLNAITYKGTIREY